MVRQSSYNVTEYLEKILEMINMELSSIIGSKSISRSEKFQLQKNTHSSIHYIEEQPFYISPSFLSIKTDIKISTLNPKFLIFSAPGATGKSALAKHISYTYQSIYWNLAKIELGEKTFVGTIVDAVGPTNYSDFISKMSCGKALLVIDALDEAELISGRKMLSNFIKDINQAIQEWTAPPVILLSRTETAQFIGSICLENKISIDHYEIGFFQETQSKEFVLEHLKKSKTKITDADKECVDVYFKTISKQITRDEAESFLGYAPVLEAISAHVNSEPNKAKLLSGLENKTNGTDIILNIMEELLKRECVKFVDAFQRACKDDYPDYDKWSELYLPIEQLARLLFYILFLDSNYDNVPNENLPARMVDEYQERINTLLSQHPFIQNRLENSLSGSCDFTGPAFRDYLLARLLLQNDTTELVKLYFSESRSDSYFPSQLFWDYYIKISEGKIYNQHVSYLYESFKAKASVKQQPYLNISQILSNDDASAEYIIGFGMNSQKDENIYYEFPLVISTDRIVFDQLSNAIIDVPELDVLIGRELLDCRISNSKVTCRQLIISANHIAIESHRPFGTLLISLQPVKREPANINTIFDILSNEDLKISFPNIQEYYKLYDYKFSQDDVKDIDITRFAYATRSIFMQFRIHGKDTGAC